MPPESWPALKRRETRHAGSREQPFGALALELARHFEQVGVEADVLVDREILVEAEALRHIAHMLLRRFRIGHGIDAIDGHRAAVRPHHAGEHAHGGGLARAVGSDEAEDLARLTAKLSRSTAVVSGKRLARSVDRDDGRMHRS